MAKKFIIIGCVLIAVGLLWPLIQKMNLGRLPGDILVKREGFRFYFPVTTCLLVSVVLTIIFWIFRK